MTDKLEFQANCIFCSTCFAPFISVNCEICTFQIC
ncbi:hypothetical protein CFU_2587 [Collimonas fungivorans Ter331]|uniref:Uncharacterized protein n=1 Tax=Collimonas fungivorans (strain Ter331) TaxID=1005048 RepID=G0AC59_COLFT|nr:hypothetical protein CFU_2587 [Collimonas fungivorans Ter331]